MIWKRKSRYYIAKRPVFQTDLDGLPDLWLTVVYPEPGIEDREFGRIAWETMESCLRGMCVIAQVWGDGVAAVHQVLADKADAFFDGKDRLFLVSDDLCAQLQTVDLSETAWVMYGYDTVPGFASYEQVQEFLEEKQARCYGRLWLHDSDTPRAQFGFWEMSQAEDVRQWLLTRCRKAGKRMVMDRRRRVPNRTDVIFCYQDVFWEKDWKCVPENQVLLGFCPGSVSETDPLFEQISWELLCRVMQGKHVITKIMGRQGLENCRAESTQLFFDGKNTVLQITDGVEESVLPQLMRENLASAECVTWALYGYEQLPMRTSFAEVETYLQTVPCLCYGQQWLMDACFEPDHAQLSFADEASAVQAREMLKEICARYGKRVVFSVQSAK